MAKLVILSKIKKLQIFDFEYLTVFKSMILHARCNN